MHRPVTCRFGQFGDHFLTKRTLRSNTKPPVDTYILGLPQTPKRYIVPAKSNENDNLQNQLIWRKFSSRSNQNPMSDNTAGSRNICQHRNISNGLGSSNKTTTHSRKDHSFAASNDSEYARRLCHVTGSKFTATEVVGLYESSTGNEDPLADLRDILYPEQLKLLSEIEKESDPLYQLSHANSVKDVLTIYSSIPGSSIQPYHTSQALSTLRHIQRLSTQSTRYLNEGDAQLFLEYNRLLALEHVYVEMLQRLNNQFSEMSLGIVAYVFQCLRHLDQPLSSPVMTNLLVHLQKHLQDMDATALSRYTIGLSGRGWKRWREKNLRKLLCLAPAVGKLDNFIDEMNTMEEIHRVAICIGMMSTLVTNEKMSKFHQKLDDIINTGEFHYDKGPSQTNDSSKSARQMATLVKVLTLYLTTESWHLSHASTIRNILYLLKGRFEDLRPDQLLIVSRVAEKLGEPVSILYELDKTIRKLFEIHIKKSEIHSRSENHVNADHEKLPSTSIKKISNSLVIDESRFFEGYIRPVDFLLSMAALKLENVDIYTVRSLIKECMNSHLFCSYIPQICDIIRLTPVGNDQDLVYEFLERSYDISQHDKHQLHRLSTQYTYFNSGYVGIIRDLSFEKKVIKDFEKDILTNPFPGEFALQLGFLLSYSDYIAPEVFDKFHLMLRQFRPVHLFAIVRGLKNRFNSVPQSIPIKSRSKKHRRGTYESFARQKITTDTSRQYMPGKKEIDFRLDELNMAISRHSFQLLSSIIDDTAVTEKLPSIDTLDRRYLKLENVNKGKGSFHKTVHTSLEGVTNTLMIFRIFLLRQKYLDEQGFNRVIGVMVKYFEDTHLNLQVIRKIADILMQLTPKHDVSKLMDQMIDYLLKNRNHMQSRSLSQPLRLAFHTSSDVLQ